MSALRRFTAVLVADLRERSRSTRFWVVLALVGIVTWWCFPPVDAGYVTVSIGASTRGLYSSAWTGMSLGLMYGTVLSLLGFYLVRGTLTRDFDTRVWQLVVATPMTRRGYLVAKWASHLAVFSLMALLGLAIGLLAQWVRAEDRHIDLIELVKPVLVISLPAFAVTAFFAILFDMVPWLRRSGGNVLYFFLWMFLFAIALILMNPQDAQWAADTWLSDPNGIVLGLRDLQSQLAVSQPGIEVAGLNVGANFFDGKPTLFEWTHWSVRPLDVLGRVLWIFVSMGAVAALAPFLDRAAAVSSGASTDRSAAPGRSLRWLEPLFRVLQHLPGGILLAAELRLVLRQHSAWWWVVLIGLGIAQLASPAQGVGIAAIVALLFSVGSFARGILRERETGTGALVFPASGAVRRVLASRVGASLLLAWGSVLPGMLHMLAVDPAAAAALLLMATNVALGGLAISALCRNPRPYELLLVMLVYVGVQGDGPLAAVAKPAWTLGVNGMLLPVLAAVLLASWPALARWR